MRQKHDFFYFLKHEHETLNTLMAQHIKELNIQGKHKIMDKKIVPLMSRNP